MMLRSFLVATSLMLVPAISNAQDIVDGGNIARLNQIIAEVNPTSSVETDSDGNLYIRAQHDGWNYDVQFYDCDGNKDCSMMQYVAQFDTNGSYRPEQALAWHSDWVWGRISFNDGDVYFEMPINLYGGVTLENFRDSHDLWLTIMGDFVNEIGWGPSIPSK